MSLVGNNTGPSISPSLGRINLNIGVQSSQRSSLPSSLDQGAEKKKGLIDDETAKKLGLDAEEQVAGEDSGVDKAIKNLRNNAIKNRDPKDVDKVAQSNIDAPKDPSRFDNVAAETNPGKEGGLQKGNSVDDVSKNFGLVKPDPAAAKDMAFQMPGTNPQQGQMQGAPGGAGGIGGGGGGYGSGGPGGNGPGTTQGPDIFTPPAPQDISPETGPQQQSQWDHSGWGGGVIPSQAPEREAS